MKRKAFMLAVALMALVPAAPAVAQGVCTDRDSMVKHLGDRHSESRQALGLVSNGNMIEVLTSKSGSWSIIITNPQGVACLVAAGEAWESIPQVALEPAA